MENLLKKLNPWWYSLDELETYTFKRNKYLDNLIDLLETKEILTISWLRRIWKSTIQKQLINYLILEKKINPKNILFFNIDILDLDSKKINIIEKIRDEFLKLNNPDWKIYLFFDEIQNLENWEKYLKIEYDLNNKNTKIILTWSNSKLLYSNISKLLTWRILNTHIFPLDFKEFLEFNNFKIKDIDYDKIKIFNFFKSYLQFWWFPEVVLEKNENIKLQRISEYFNSIILRDILEFNNIRESKIIFELARYLITNSTKLFSYNSLAKVFWISKITIKEYIWFLQNSFLFEELPKFDYSVQKQIFNEKKIYTLNQDFLGLGFQFSQNIWRQLENLVFIELKRRWYEMYYHKSKKECDFLIRDRWNIVLAVQVCYSLYENDTKTREINWLLEAIKMYDLKEWIILTNDEDENIEIDWKKIKILPIWKWLLLDL